MTAPQTIRIDVRLFAGLREHAGAGRTALEVPEGATAGEARAALWPALGVDSPGADAAMALAVNREYAAADTVLRDGDELALIPPVSGGAGPGEGDGSAGDEGGPGPVDGRGSAGGDGGSGSAGGDGGPDDHGPDHGPADGLGDGPGDDLIHAAVTADPIDQAALHARVARREAGGIVTFSGMARDVPQLDYEAHEEMARERMAAILAEVVATHGACAAAAEHRVGAVPWPEAAVVVAVSAPHRGEAFAAAREALDRIKAEAPIWKQEVDGDERAWVAGTLPGTGAGEASEGGASDGVPSGDGPSGGAASGAPSGGTPSDASSGAPRGGAPTDTTPGEPGERHPGGLLPHLRPDGGATMVDVGGKAVTERRAVAAALLSTTPETAALIAAGDLPKGDVLGVARIAGISAAKRVPDLVPLAHPLPLTKVDVRAEVVPDAGQVRITAEARTVGTTGVEIEAMTAALVAAINVYDMVKGVERGIAVGPVGLVHKSGGRTGDFIGPAPWEPGFRAADATGDGGWALVESPAAGEGGALAGSPTVGAGGASADSPAAGGGGAVADSPVAGGGGARADSPAVGEGGPRDDSRAVGGAGAPAASPAVRGGEAPVDSPTVRGGAALVDSPAAIRSPAARLAPEASASPAHARSGARDAAKPLDPPVAVGLLTVSTSRADGPPDDPGTVALRSLAADLGARAVVEERVRDEREAIESALRRFADDHGCDLVLTAGGTGCTVDDVTPEATLAACDRQVPGIAEALRLESREHTHAWPLSRGVAAIRGRTLVVNLPGTPKAAAEALPVLAPVLTHAVRLLRR